MAYSARPLRAIIGGNPIPTDSETPDINAKSNDFLDFKKADRRAKERAFIDAHTVQDNGDLVGNDDLPYKAPVKGPQYPSPGQVHSNPEKLKGHDALYPNYNPFNEPQFAVSENKHHHDSEEDYIEHLIRRQPNWKPMEDDHSYDDQDEQEDDENGVNDEQPSRTDGLAESDDFNFHPDFDDESVEHVLHDHAWREALHGTWVHPTSHGHVIHTDGHNWMHNDENDDTHAAGEGPHTLEHHLVRFDVDQGHCVKEAVEPFEGRNGPLPGGQGYDPDHVDHPLHYAAAGHGYRYSHSTPISQLSGDQAVYHTYKKGNHSVNFYHDGMAWKTKAGSGRASHVGVGATALSRHLLNKARTYPELAISESLGAKASVKDFIDDFQKSNAPQFKGKSQEKRRQMAIAAAMSRKDKK